MVVQPTALVVSEDENRIFPGVTLHQGRDDRLHILCPNLNVVLGMLISAAGTRTAIDKNYFRQSFVGIASSSAACSRQPVQQIADRESFGSNRRIREIGEVREKDAVFVVV